MAHKRKDTYTPPPEWWKHMRPFNKRHIAHRERRKATDMIRKEVKDMENVVAA